ESFTGPATDRKRRENLTTAATITTPKRHVSASDSSRSPAGPRGPTDECGAPFGVEQVGLGVRARRERAGHPFEELIGEARVARQHRPVQVRADDVAAHDAVGRAAALGMTRAEGHAAVGDRGDAAMVLEPHDPTGAERLVAHGDLTDETL